MQKQKLQQQQVAAAVAAAAQNQQVAGTQPATQVQSAQAAQASPQLTAVAAPRTGTVLTGTTVTNLQVARLVNAPFFTFTSLHKHHLLACVGRPALGRVPAALLLQSDGGPDGVGTSHIGSRKTPVS